MTSRIRTREILAAFSLSILLTACGGEGGGDDVLRVGGGGGDTGGGGGGQQPAADPVADAFNGGTGNRQLATSLNANGTPGPNSPDLQNDTFTFTAGSPDLQDNALALPAGLATPLGTVLTSSSFVGAFAQEATAQIAALRGDNKQLVTSGGGNATAAADDATWSDEWTVSINGNRTVWQPASGGTLNGAAPTANGTCPTGTTDIGDQQIPASLGGGQMDICQLAARYNSDGQTLTLTNDNIYRLGSGFPGTFIGDGECQIGAMGCAADAASVSSVTLSIEQGVLILGNTQEALIVTRGSQIQANGTRTDPIVMTSLAQFNAFVGGGDGTSGRGEWAGLALMGFAQSNECAGTPCNVNAEGNIGFYGGSDDTDSSGSLNFVVIRHAGNDIDGNGNELNGLTFFATGSGTSASFIQVHKGLDDGTEHFGGATFMQYVVLTDNGDDSFDWGQGWRGGAQFVIIRQAQDEADRGIEADNDNGNPDAMPRSAPTLSNFTIIGRPDGDSGADGILLRRGTGALIYNFLVSGFRDACLDVDGDATAALFGNNDGILQIHNTSLFCPDGATIEDDGDVALTAIENWFNSDAANTTDVDPNLRPDGRLNAASGGAGGGFTTTNYIGAFAQDTQDDWADGWTVSLNGNETVWQAAPAMPVADGMCPAGTTDEGDQALPVSLGGGAMDLCRLESRYTSDLTLTNDNIYLIGSGFPGTIIGDGECEIGAQGCAATADALTSATLEIEPGTLVLGSSQEALVVSRGSRILALGTADAPIVMSSRTWFDDLIATGDGESGRGEWAGLALLGLAQSNECSGDICNVNAEGNIGFYGGSDDTDDSGTLSYVVIRHAGNDIDGNGNELNGLTFFATGSGTDVSFVQVHDGLDDGAEHFGGATVMDHVVLTSNADDSLDWGQGWRGGAQFVIIVQADDDADRGIEADNDQDNNDATPLSAPTIANLTIIGSGGGTTDADTIGILLRRGTAVTLANSIVTGSDTCLDIQGDSTQGRFDDSTSTITNTVLDCTNAFPGTAGSQDGSSGGGDQGTGTTDTSTPEGIFNVGDNNQLLDPQVGTDGKPTSSSPDLQGDFFSFVASSPDLADSTFTVPASLGTFFENVDYIGAFDQANPVNWTAGWTVSLNGNTTVWEPATGGTLAGGTPSADGTCPAGTTDIGDQALPADVGGGMMDLCQLAARYNTDGQTLTLTNDNIYALASGFPGTYIGDGECQIGAMGCAVSSDGFANVILDIEPGVLLLGDSGEALIITRGSQIQVNGTETDPVVMTSIDQFSAWVAGGDGTSGRGEWAGLALQGLASSNECGAAPCNVNAEGNIGFYGGANDTDNSGSMEYLVIRHAGNDIDGNGNELNGLTFFATGSATTSSYVQVHKGLDDGVEHFGATDNMDHIVLTDNADDSFDWGQGYRGSVQFAVIRQALDDGDRGIEADNDNGNPDALPRSAPTLANFTIIGQPLGEPGADGILLRRGTAATIYNFIVTGFRDACLDVDEAQTAALFGNNDGVLQIHNTVLWCPDGVEFEEDGNVTAASIQAWFETDASNTVRNPNVLANGIPNPLTGIGLDFESTDYAGAFTQDTDDGWTDDWTVSINGNTTVWTPALTEGTLGDGQPEMGGPNPPAADGMCPAGTTDEGDQDLSNIGMGGGMDLCRLAGRYTSDLTLTNDNIYLLGSGFPGTFIGDGECEIGAMGCAATADAVTAVTLTIEPGTLVLGDNGEALIVTRGATIEANGTQSAPIVMTSVDQFLPFADGTADGTSGRGEWAGLALMGFAQSNECSGDICNVNAEGNIGFYGGSDDADSSGSLNFVVIRHAGNDIDGNGNELNGLTYFAVGSGTRGSFIQVHKGLDDGVEHFGGRAFIDHVLLTDNADDSLDWGQGWRGGAQYVLIRQADDDADRGIEADNDNGNNNAEPISAPNIANITILGSGGGTPDADTTGILLRRGTGANIFNAIVTGSDFCLDIDDDATFDRVGEGRLSFTNTIFSCATNFLEE